MRAALTPREREVIELKAAGYTSREIAEQLGVSYYTVRTHINNILHAMHAHSMSSAVATAYREGLLKVSRLTRAKQCLGCGQIITTQHELDTHDLHCRALQAS